MKITDKEIEKYANEMLSKMGEHFKSTESFRRNFEKNKKNIYPQNISFCLEKFLHTEFDYETPGSRGLGRMSDYWPRLAAYFRDSFSKLSIDEMGELDSQITALIVKCYLFTILISDKSAVQTVLTDEQLFEKWIPQIYMFDLSGMGENSGNVLFALIQKNYEEIKSFFKKHGMKPVFLSGDKTTEILNGYVAAGLVMLIVEKS